MRARCSQPLSTNQTPHPTTKAGQQPNPPPKGRNHPRFPQTTGRRGDGPVVSKPNSVSGNSLTAPRPLTKTSRGPACLSRTRTTPTTGAAHPSNRPAIPNPHTMWAGLSLVVLLRKEVIQPHLPVRLPFSHSLPIPHPTFTASLPHT